MTRRLVLAGSGVGSLRAGDIAYLDLPVNNLPDAFYELELSFGTITSKLPGEQSGVGLNVSAVVAQTVVTQSGYIETHVGSVAIWLPPNWGGARRVIQLGRLPVAAGDWNVQLFGDGPSAAYDNVPINFRLYAVDDDWTIAAPTVVYGDGRLAVSGPRGRFLAVRSSVLGLVNMVEDATTPGCYYAANSAYAAGGYNLPAGDVDQYDIIEKYDPDEAAQNVVRGTLTLQWLAPGFGAVDIPSLQAHGDTNWTAAPASERRILVTARQNGSAVELRCSLRRGGAAPQDLYGVVQAYVATAAGVSYQATVTGTPAEPVLTFANRTLSQLGQVRVQITTQKTPVPPAEDGEEEDWEGAADLAALALDQRTPSDFLARASTLPTSGAVVRTTDLAAAVGSATPIEHDTPTHLAQVSPAASGILQCYPIARVAPGEDFLVQLDCADLTQGRSLDGIGSVVSDNPAVAFTSAGRLLARALLHGSVAADATPGTRVTWDVTLLVGSRGTPPVALLFDVIARPVSA